MTETANDEIGLREAPGEKPANYSWPFSVDLDKHQTILRNAVHDLGLCLVTVNPAQ